MLFPSPDLLIEEAFAWTARWATWEAPPLHVDPTHRFRIRSSLQKAVRRGEVEWAVRMALALHRLDRRYAWRSILTIAVEDVGIANPDTVLWATMAQKASFRRGVGETPLLIALTRCMAMGLKSRAAIDLAFVTETGEREMFRLFATMSSAQLVSRYMADDPYEAYAALSVIRGIVPSGCSRRSVDPAAINIIIAELEGQVAQPLVRAVRASLLHPLDNMSMGFVVAARLYPGDEGEEVRDHIPDSVQIDGFPAETYDQHERLGRSAIAAFAQHIAPRSAELSRLSPSRARRVVADAVFLEEGQALNRWMASPALARLRREADGFSLSRHGLSGDECASLQRLVRNEIVTLHAVRATLARGGT